MDEDPYDVVVVGYGPIGQTLTSLLGSLGHRVAALDKHPRLYGLPRQIGMHAEALRIVSLAGNRDLALRESAPNLRALFLDASGDLLTEMTSGPSDQGFPAITSTYQPNIEDAIDRQAKRHGATVLLGYEVVDVAQDDHRATVRAVPRHADDGADDRLLTAGYVIAADGADSFVRRQVGFARDDFGFREAWVSIDAELAPRFHGTFDGPTFTLDPAGTRAAVPVGTTRIRLEVLANPDADHSALLEPDAGYDVAERLFGFTRQDITIYRQVVYPFAATLATSWRSGRILLAGDAAHLMPPFTGQGATSGLRDAAGLAWRLDLVLRGISGPALLDTYDAERIDQVREVIEQAVQTGEMMCTSDPVAAARRDAMLRSLAAPAQHPVSPGYRRGVLHRAGLPGVGELVPQGRVGVAGRTGLLDDVLGWGWLLISERDRRADLTDAQQTFLETIGCRLVHLGDDRDDTAPAIRDIDGTYREYFDRLGVAGVVVRPDFRVFATVHGADLGAVVDDLRDQLRVTVPARPEPAGRSVPQRQREESSL